MPERKVVTGHYTHGGLLEAIREGVRRSGKTIEEIGVDDLGPVDEFHIGGRAATRAFLDQLQILATHHVLDVGCGLGGAARYAARTYGCRVTGVDLTPEYVEAGNALCEWTGMQEQVTLAVEDATGLSFADETFDQAYMLHVGMNIEDKAALARELHRVVHPGGKVGIYDVMRTGEAELVYPVPWAAQASGSALAPPPVYKAALEDAGFRIVAERNRRDFALEYFAQVRARNAEAGGPPPLGTHIMMGPTAPDKIANMIDNISRDAIAPVELIAEKPS